MKAELWAEIKRLRTVAGRSISAIARTLQLDRKTVRAALSCDVSQQPHLVRRRPSKLDAYKSYIIDRLATYPRIPATALYEEISRLGYTGKIRIVWAYVEGLRAKRQEAFVRIETQPGEYAQVDWANCGSVRIGTALRKISCFVMVLGYSRMMYLEFRISQCLEDFLQCHSNAFSFFGGVPKKILYDNVKTVVLSRIGKDIQLNIRFAEFAGVFLFEPICCNPAKGNEKGKVESSIKYIRSNFLSRTDITWPGINPQAIAWRDRTANTRLHATTRERPIDRFAKEQSFLMKLPDKAYDASITRSLHASNQALIHFDGNTYSLPYTYASRGVALKATLHEVKIFDMTKLIAHHRRSFERGICIEDPAHYAGLLAEKKRARASKLKEQFIALGQDTPAYFEGLLRRELNVSHHVSAIMECVRLYGKTEVLHAINRALSHNAFGASYVKNIIFQQRSARGVQEPAPIVIHAKPVWTTLTVEEQDLSLYDDIYTDAATDAPHDTTTPVPTEGLP